MKTIFSLILLFISYTATSQQQEIIRLDSCLQFGANPFDDLYIRVQQHAQWKSKKPSLASHIEAFFDAYVQKKAGGKITLSILVNKDGKPCTYEARPNSNVRPNYSQLKAWMDQYEWVPAMQGGEPVRSVKILQISFEGKKLTVTELE
jgi:hypothetical protein